MKSELLRMDHISKTFPGIKALNNACINVFKGEVLGLMGENGAGKTTLMRILSGNILRDSGVIYFENKKVSISSPQDSQELGISTIHQNFSIVPNLSIAENIFMIKDKFFFNKKSTYIKSQKFLKKVGLNVDASMLVKDLTLAQKQMVEVAKILATNAKLIIMDETTSMLDDNDVKVLFNIIKKLKQHGVSVIFISHKINEVFSIADRITVLRDGYTVGTLYKNDWSQEKLINFMLGSQLKNFFIKSQKPIGEEILKVENLSTKGLLNNVSFSLRKGEVLSIAGLVGSGRSELLEVLFGLIPKEKGNIILDGKEIEIKSPKDAIKNKIALVPEDRRLQGLILNMNVKNNVTLSILKRVSKKSFINAVLEKHILKEYLNQLNISRLNPLQSAGTLSSGEQQKIVLAKWLSIRPKILLLDQPTRAVDVESRKNIYQIIDKLSKNGVSIILVSSELREITGIGDRILVIKNGQVGGELNRYEATQGKILMTINKDI